jgi:hypothetical protein
MRLEELKKLSKKQLKEKIDDCFNRAESSGGLDQGPLYEQAHFFIQELDRRHDSWISTRDLILEIVVIALIGWEINLGIRQGDQQSKQFEQEQGVMTSLGQSAASTAEILTALEATLDLKGLDSHQPVNHLPVSVDINYNPEEKSLTLTNLGSSNIEVLEYQFDGRRGPKLHSPQKVVPGGSFAGIRTTGLMDTVPDDVKGQPFYMPLRVTLTGPDGKTYQATTPLALTPMGGSYHISCGRTFITEAWWPRQKK